MTVRRKRKDRTEAYTLFSDGWSLRAIEQELEIPRGTLSKWRNSNDFAQWHAQRTVTGPDSKPQKVALILDEMHKEAETTPGDLDVVAIRGRFLNAISVGGLQWAQAYAMASDEQTAMFLRELNTGKVHATARIAVLQMMLNLARNESTPSAVRLNAMMNWFRLAENNIHPAPMIQINAGNASGGNDEHAVYRVMLDEMRRHLDNPDPLDMEDQDERSELAPNE